MLHSGSALTSRFGVKRSTTLVDFRSDFLLEAKRNRSLKSIGCKCKCTMALRSWTHVKFVKRIRACAPCLSAGFLVNAARCCKHGESFSSARGNSNNCRCQRWTSLSLCLSLLRSDCLRTDEKRFRSAASTRFDCWPLSDSSFTPENKSNGAGNLNKPHSISPRRRR